MNTCEICGGKLKQDGSCPACEAKQQQNKAAKKKLLLPILGGAAVLVALVCAFLLGRLGKPTEEKPQEQPEEKYVSKYEPEEPTEKEPAEKEPSGTMEVSAEKEPEQHTETKKPEKDPIPEFVASDYDATGTCGKNAKWGFNEATGELTIIGTGAMDDYGWSVDTTSPWRQEYYDQIRSVQIMGVTNIGEFAFYYCKNLTSVTIADSVTSIDFYAFWQCESLTEITIPGSVKTIECGAFTMCSSLTSVTLSDGIETIEKDSFIGCALTSISLPDSVKNFSATAFAGPNLTHIYADNEAYVDVDGVLFTKDMKTLLKYPNGRTQSSYTIPDGVTTIGADAILNGA